MDTAKLTSLCKNDPKLDKVFEGVFPYDCLPVITAFPTAYIANTDPQTKPGAHWIAMYFDHDGNGDYLDSYGRMPLPKFKSFLDKYSIEWQYNNKQLQAPLTSTCGQYCIYFLYQRSRGVPMQKILDGFGNDKFKNDKMVTDFVNKTFGTNTAMIDVNYIVNQVCKALNEIK